MRTSSGQRSHHFLRKSTPVVPGMRWSHRTKSTRWRSSRPAASSASGMSTSKSSSSECGAAASWERRSSSTTRCARRHRAGCGQRSGRPGRSSAVDGEVAATVQACGWRCTKPVRATWARGRSREALLHAFVLGGAKRASGRAVGNRRRGAPAWRRCAAPSRRRRPAWGARRWRGARSWRRHRPKQSSTGRARRPAPPAWAGGAQDLHRAASPTRRGSGPVLAAVQVAHVLVVRVQHHAGHRPHRVGASARKQPPAPALRQRRHREPARSRLRSPAATSSMARCCPRRFGRPPF